jgi:hypothetical protein
LNFLEVNGRSLLDDAIRPQSEDLLRAMLGLPLWTFVVMKSNALTTEDTKVHKGRRSNNRLWLTLCAFECFVVIDFDVMA